ncbi:MAG TPA: hypothetical protein VLT36_10530, partial [Candidatus Dormibacteraeota bacterium]|nr:hypothetical protein [Candidatus Dormibacteraeota bacterium]
MKIRILFWLGVVLSFVLGAQANVTVTGASGGAGISADTAVSGGTAAWTTLGPIRIDEGAKGDFAAGSGVTLVLKAPAGFEFNTSSIPSISFAAGADITGASVAINNPTTITATFTVSGTGSKNDVLTIGNTGLQVRPVQAAPLPAALHLYRPSSGGGTATIAGVTTSTDGSSGSNFGSLSEAAGSFVKLQLLMPGETASPGAASGKTGSPTAEIAGTAFNVTVNGVDTNWNVVPGASGASFTVHLASSDVNATIPADASLTSGTHVFSVIFRTAGSAALTASDASDGTKTSSTSPTTTINVGAFSKLQILAPGESAVPGSSTGRSGSPSPQVAGVAFSVAVNAVDANWNPISTNDIVAITSSDGNAVLPPNASLSGGTGTFNVTLKTAGTRTVTGSDVTHNGIAANTSSAISVAPAAFVQLQLLMPGETAVPGTASGKTGSATSEIAGVAFTITVNAVDSFWNLIGSVTDTIGFTSSDSNAILPANTPLTAGTGNFNIT